MKRNILKYLTLGIVALTLFTACRKDGFVSDDTKLGDKGATFVKVLEGPSNALFFSPFTTIKTVDLFSVRRDAASSASLNTAISVKLTENAAALAAYNLANATNFVTLDPAIYTLPTNSSIIKTATGYTFNFAAGEFSKELTILLNGALFDLTKKYALAFNITDAGNGATTTATSQKSIIVLISIKNKYDGNYTVTGTMSDIANANLSHVNNVTGIGAPVTLQLRTVSATKCAVYEAVNINNYSAPISNAGGLSQYGSFSIIIEFDPVTNKPIAVTNYYGQPAGNGRYAGLDATGINTWVGGTMKIKYNMFQPSVVPLPSARTTWVEEWQYTGPR